MFTDIGFQYLLQIAEAPKDIAYLRYGLDPSKVINLNPPKNITRMQDRDEDSPALGPSEKHKVYSGHENNFIIFNQGNINHYSTKFYNSHTGYAGPNYIERGVFSTDNKLIYYQVNTNKEKTLKVIKTPDQVDSLDIKFNIPFSTLDKPISCLNNGELTEYILRIKSIKSLTNINIYNPVPRVFKLKSSSSNADIVIGEAQLSTYDLTLRTALFNLIIEIPSNKISSGNYLYLETVFASFSMTLHDPISGDPVAWPLTNGEALIIPLEINLGDA